MTTSVTPSDQFEACARRFRGTPDDFPTRARDLELADLLRQVYEQGKERAAQVLEDEAEAIAKQAAGHAAYEHHVAYLDKLVAQIRQAQP